MEFDLSGAISWLAAIQLASRLQTSSQLVPDQLRTGLRPGSSYLDMSR